MAHPTKGQPKKVYTAEDHEAAFRAYFVSRNLNHVSRRTEVSYGTLLSWKENNPCPFGCPFHNWEALVNEQNAVIEAQNKLAEAGVPPEQHEAAIEVAVEAAQSGYVAEEQKAKPYRLTPEHELDHWTHIYAKTYYDYTGIALDYSTWKEAQAGQSLANRTALLTRGLRHTSAEGAIRSLQVIADKIRALEATILGAKNIVANANESTRSSGVGDVSTDEIRRLLALAEKPDALSSAIAGYAKS